MHKSDKSNLPDFFEKKYSEDISQEISPIIPVNPTENSNDDNLQKDLPNIIRSDNDGKNNFYTKIDNHLIKNPDLDFLAIGIMAWMLSQDKTFKFYKEVVQKKSGFGKTLFNKAWNKLKELNYIISKKQRDENGQFCKNHWIVNENNTYQYTNNNSIDRSSENIKSSAPKTDNNHKAENGMTDNRSMDNDKVVSHDLVDHSTNNDPLISKSSCNQEQLNQEQLNQNQLNQETNGADFSARITENIEDIPMSPADYPDDIIGIAPEEELTYTVQNPTNFSDIPQIRTDQFDANLFKVLQPYFNDEGVIRTCHMYSYLVWKNIQMFNYEKANEWKMNEKDYDNLDLFCNDQTVTDFSHLTYIADSIFEKAQRANEGRKYISVSYLTSQISKMYKSEG